MDRLSGPYPIRLHTPDTLRPRSRHTEGHRIGADRVVGACGRLKCYSLQPLACCVETVTAGAYEKLAVGALNPIVATGGVSDATEPALSLDLTRFWVHNFPQPADITITTGILFQES